MIQTICQTAFGRFKIKMDNKNINVGGRTFCANIALYDNETALYWLKTDEGGCELNEQDIRGINTIKMTDLAFSMLKRYYPDRTEPVTLLDDSGFSWKDKKGIKHKTNFLKGYLLLNRKTWYEAKFNAVICDPEIYKEYRKRADNNFDDPTKKPAIFNFMNSEDKLKPLYDNSKTWGEFIDKFVTTYGDEKYKLMNEWYRQAIYIIFDGMEINQNWKIDILKRPYIECNFRTGGYGKIMTKKNKRITFSDYYRLEPFNWSP